MELVREEMQKTATHIVPSEILDDAPRTLLRPSKPLLFFPLSLDSLFSPFRTIYFTNAWLSADVLFCPRRRMARRERDCITAARSFAKLRCEETGEKLCCLWRIDKRSTRQRKNAVCEVHSRVSRLD